MPGETGGPNKGRALVLGQEEGQEEGQEGGKTIVRVAGASPMSRSLATWDRTSGMSKKEWKATCERLVKENPGLYSKPF